MFDLMEGIDIDADESELIKQISDLERRKAADAAAQAVLTAALVAKRDAAEQAARVAADKRRRGLGSEIALARKDSPNCGNRHLGFALALVYEMPHTRAALAAGVLTEWRATIIVRESACLTVDDRRTLDEELCSDLSTLDGLGNKRITADAKKIAYRLDPEAVVARAGRAKEERTVWVRPAPDCMSYVTALMPVAQGVGVYAALKKAADTTCDGRTRGQVMADTLYERVTGHSAAVPTPVDVGLVIDDEALLAGADTPATLTGYGPIPAEIGRQLIKDALTDPRSTATLRRLYRHPKSGALVAMESRSRVFPPGLARFIRTRDQSCRTPYCNAEIRHIDHTTPDARGGPTTGVNGEGKCEHCNYAKEAPGWTTTASVDHHGTHTTEYTTPTGHKYRSQAPPLPG